MATRRVHRPAAPPPARLNLRPLIAVTIALAAIVRLAASWNDLWLDEIWTLQLIGQLRSPLEIMTTLHHDNNHVLNSLLVYALRPIGWDWVYRVPSLLAGVAIVALGAIMAATDDAAAPRPPDSRPQARALAAALVLGVSHPMIQYASEARGYALSLAFGLGAIVVAVRDGVRPRSRAAPACWALLVLAFLSHALAIHAIAALAGWMLVRTLRREPVPTAIATCAWWLAIPVLAFGAFYAGFLRGITVGGGNREGLIAPLGRALAVVSGLPLDVPFPVTLLVVGAVAAAGLWVIARTGSDLWVLFIVGTLVSPAALMVIVQTDLYAERYFLVSMLLWLLLLAQLLSWLAARRGPALLVAALMFGLFGLANVTRVGALLRDGRGSYQDALRFMVAHTIGPTTEIASDHDFRNRLVIEYFAPRMAKPVRYVPRGDATLTQWYVAHRSFGDAPPPQHLTVSRGSYHLVRTVPAAMLSGLAWFLYERDAP